MSEAADIVQATFVAAISVGSDFFMFSLFRPN